MIEYGIKFLFIRYNGFKRRPSKFDQTFFVWKTIHEKDFNEQESAWLATERWSTSGLNSGTIILFDISYVVWEWNKLYFKKSFSFIKPTRCPICPIQNPVGVKMLVRLKLGLTHLKPMFHFYTPWKTPQNQRLREV